MTEKYHNTLQEKIGRRLIFLDETGSNLHLMREYARSKKGVPVHSPKPLRRGKNITTIGALSRCGMVASLFFEGGLNQYIFHYFLKECLAPHLKEGDIVICDNATAHKGEEAREILAEYGAEILFLPPYSPELNPIEMAWGKGKQYIKSVVTETKEHLFQTITEALDTITWKDSIAWFRHCGYI